MIPRRLRPARPLLPLLGAAVLALAAWQAAAAPAAGAAARLAEIEAHLRGRPEEAITAVQEALPAASGDTQIEMLVLQGWMQARMADGEGLERTAQELDQMPPARQPLAHAAAGLLRGRWASRHGSLGRADRLLAEAAARMPTQAPLGLRLHLLEAQAKVKQSLGKLEDSVRLSQQAVALADRTAPAWQRSELRSALAYTLYLAQQFDRASQVNREAIDLSMLPANLLARSAAMSTEGMLLNARGRKAEELQAMRESIALAHAAGATRDAVLGLANLADYYLKHSDPAKALELAREALPMAREVRDRTSESVALANAGLALIELKRRDEGVKLVREALLLDERAGALTAMSAIQQELGMALEKTGYLKEAWAALVEHRRLADEVFQRDQQQALLELQESFDAERRQRDVALLQTEMGLKEAQLVGRDLQHRLWSVGLLAGVLLLALVGLLLGRMRRSNAQLSDSNAQLQVASQRDALTGLANRRHFYSEMQQQGGPAFEGSLLLIDIDHFKQVNDRHGHNAGDAVLVEIAQRLRAALRAEDLIVRWGGEEFLVLVRELPAAQVEALTERLLAAIGGRPVLHGRASIAVTASIGFATFPLRAPAGAPPGWEQAIDLVDTAMYLAKAHGRNRAYGVRSLRDDPAKASLEQAWRSGGAELALLSGPPLPEVAA